MKEKIAFIDCTAGVAGDMFISACIDAGVDKDQLERTLKRGLKIQGWKISVKDVQRGHTTAKTLTVLGDRSFGSAAHMLAVLKKSHFPGNIKESSLAILGRIIAAEAAVHGVQRTDVHFHELDSIDTLVDITGACAAAASLGIEKVYATPINVGKAAPATLEIVKNSGTPVFSPDSRYELATPTGVAIVAGIAQSFDGMPPMTVERTGRGAGTRVIPDGPGPLRIVTGTGLTDGSQSTVMDETVLLETNIDDMDPRVYQYVMEKLFTAGVKDVWLTQVLMKKGRPGVLLSVLCDASHEEAAVRIVFSETTTLGIRRLVCPRYILEREKRAGRKVARLAGGKFKVAEEYEIAKQRAVKTGRPLKDLL